MRIQLIIVVLSTMLISSCTEDKMPTLIELDMELRGLIEEASPTKTSEFYILPDPSDLSSLPQQDYNILTPEKVELGKMLFFETGLARDAVKSEGMQTYSCSTCHIPEAGFKSGNFQGIADGGIGFGINGTSRLRNTSYDESELDVQSARPLSMVNVGFVHNTSWNGSFGATHVNVGTEEYWVEEGGLDMNHMGMQGLETQNIEGIHLHRLTYTPEVIEELGYKEMFDKAFPEFSEEERYSPVTGSFALSAYLRTLMSTKAPFQDWLKGNLNALSYSEKRGGILFFGKAKCSTCHYRENLGSLEFHALGVKDLYQGASYTPDPNDPRTLGRGGFTGLDEDLYKFKVPGLYNVGDTEFYFHGSSHTSLKSLIDYKDKAVSENPNISNEMLSDKFETLNLTEDEKHHLVEFLEKSLRDPDLNRYKPQDILSGNCFPNNDPQSKTDIGCE